MIRLGVYKCRWCGHEEQESNDMDAHVVEKHTR